MRSFSTPNEKMASIRKWVSAIEKLEQQIELLKADQSLSVIERQKKIARRMDIISNYKFEIRQAQDYIDLQNKKTAEIYERDSKTK